MNKEMTVQNLFTTIAAEESAHVNGGAFPIADAAALIDDIRNAVTDAASPSAAVISGDEFTLSLLIMHHASV